MAASAGSSEPRFGSQAGVSLVEIVVAMFILAVMSVAVLPLVIGAVKVSAGNRDLLAATSLANAQLAILQATFPNSAANSCAAVRAKAATGIADGSKSGVSASITPGACPSDPMSYPTTVTVTVQVYRADSPQAVTTLNSAILVSST